MPNKKKQQRTAVRRAAATSRGVEKSTIVAVVAVIVLAAAVIGGVLWTNSGETEGEAIPVASTEGELNYPGHREGVVVVRGDDQAKVTLDMYEDFLCPACGQFEKRYGPDIEKKIAAGELRVRYHMVPMLNESSDPPGYSLDAANAALAAADHGKFVPFHKSLFDSQPREGGSGYSNAQLIELGENLGITGEKFASDVESGTYEAKLKAALNEATNDPSLKQQGNGRSYFGTPTVVANGKVLDVFNNPNWLSDVLSEQSQ